MSRQGIVEFITFAFVTCSQRCQPRAASRVIELRQHIPLTDAVAVQVRGLLEPRQVRHQIGRCREIPQSQTGRQTLRIGALINPACAPQPTANRCALAGFVHKIAIGIVFEQGHGGFVARGSQGHALRCRVAIPGGILKGGNDISETRPFAAKHLAVCTVQSHKACTEIAEHLQCRKIGRRFHRHRRTGIDEQLARQIDALLRAREYQHLLLRAFQPELPQILRDLRAQCRFAFGGAVLQRAGGHRTQVQTREGFRRRQAPGKGDHAGPVDHRQDVADGRGAQILRAPGEFQGGRHGQILLRSIYLSYSQLTRLSRICQYD